MRATGRPSSNPDPHGEIVAIDAERDVDIHRVHIRTPDQEAPDLATGENRATNGIADAMGSGTQICNHCKGLLSMPTFPPRVADRSQMAIPNPTDSFRTAP